jgi:hypothetical protein
VSKTGQATLCPKRTRGRGKKTEALISETLDVLATFEGSMSTRQVYYQLVSRGAVENKNSEYDRVQRLLVELRRDRRIPYDRIVDRTRGKHQRAGWDGVEDIMEAVAQQYRRDLWADQKTVVMVACEKQALEGIFSEIVDEYGASLWTLRGYGSESFMFEWATEIKRLTKAGKFVVIAYFGDFDPSGLSIEEDCWAKLQGHGAEFGYRRWGLIKEDFDRFDLVNVPVKTTDSRASSYLKEHGNRAAELDALPPDELRDRIRLSITRFIDGERWERLRATEQAERDSLLMVSANWDRAVQGAAS